MLSVLDITNSQGEVVPREFTPKPARVHVSWPEAASAAITVWSRVAVHDDVSEQSRAIAARNAEIVTALASKHGTTGRD